MHNTYLPYDSVVLEEVELLNIIRSYAETKYGCRVGQIEIVTAVNARFDSDGKPDYSEKPSMFAPLVYATIDLHRCTEDTDDAETKVNPQNELSTSNETPNSNVHNSKPIVPQSLQVKPIKPSLLDDMLGHEDIVCDQGGKRR